MGFGVGGFVGGSVIEQLLGAGCVNDVYACTCRGGHVCLLLWPLLEYYTYFLPRIPESFSQA